MILCILLNGQTVKAAKLVEVTILWTHALTH
jgi:hypothetical protein